MTEPVTHDNVDDMPPHEDTPQAQSDYPADPPAEAEAASAQGQDGDDSLPLTAQQTDAARHFGLTDEDVAALGPAAEDVLTRLARIRSDISRRYSQIGRAQQRISGPSGRQSDPAARGSGAADAPGRPLPPAERFDPQIDGPAAARLNRLVETVNALLAGRQPAFPEGGPSADDGREAAEEFFALHAADCPQLGQGPTEQLAADSSAARLRRQLLGKAQEIRNGHRIVTGEPMSLGESLQQALAVVAPEAIRSAERRRIREGVRQRSRWLLSRPSGRHTAAAFASDEERAAAEISLRARQLGVRLEP